ncbi:MAG: HlyD family efflux transporter periplasmic adaptor subunit [Pseudomonadota bacterium]
MNGLRSRTFVIGLGVAALALFFTYAFWPRAEAVDMATIERAPMIVTINEEAKTRVHDAYIVSMPVTGRLLRVEVEPGDSLSGGETVIGEIAPARPSVLDMRTQEQAQAAVAAAEAALSLAQAEIDIAQADVEYRRVEVERARELKAYDGVSGSELDAAESAWRAARASLARARASARMRDADLANARAMLMSFDEPQGQGDADIANGADLIRLTAPISGRVLRVIQESEAVLAAGSPVIEIGDPQNDLEIVAELLSSDAVQVDAGDRVIIEKWGGPNPLIGIVERVEPWGFTKFSALGVEEQRVNAVIQFAGDGANEAGLGHGYRADVRIVIWEDDNALVAPANALFRVDGAWAVFAVENGRAVQTLVEIGQNNGAQAAITAGLDEGDTVVLYPGSRIKDRLRVKPRDNG